MSSAFALDLVALVADKDIEQTLRGLLEKRQASLGIRVSRFQVFVHTRHDPAMLRESVAILASVLGRARHALALFDHEGSGSGGRSAEQVQQDLTDRLAAGGWGDRAAAIVIAPELEAWVWSDSPHVASALGWDDTARLREWLTERGHWRTGEAKPARPKEAFEAALTRMRTPRSAAIFRQLAEEVGLQRCTDKAFARLCGQLRTWFGTE